LLRQQLSLEPGQGWEQHSKDEEIQRSSALGLQCGTNASVNRAGLLVEGSAQGQWSHVGLCPWAEGHHSASRADCRKMSFPPSGFYAKRDWMKGTKQLQNSCGMCCRVGSPRHGV
jgi:hypothetical protein